MKKLFGKVIKAKSDSAGEGWLGIMYVYGSEIDDGYERARIIRGSKIYKEEMRFGLPVAEKASNYIITKPTEKQCKNFIINAFNAFD